MTGKTSQRTKSYPNYAIFHRNPLRILLKLSVLLALLLILPLGTAGPKSSLIVQVDAKPVLPIKGEAYARVRRADTPLAPRPEETSHETEQDDEDTDNSLETGVDENNNEETGFVYTERVPGRQLVEVGNVDAIVAPNYVAPSQFQGEYYKESARRIQGGSMKMNIPPRPSPPSTQSRNEYRSFNQIYDPFAKKLVTKVQIEHSTGVEFDNAIKPGVNNGGWLADDDAISEGLLIDYNPTVSPLRPLQRLYNSGISPLRMSPVPFYNAIYPASAPKITTPEGVMLDQMPKVLPRPDPAAKEESNFRDKLNPIVRESFFGTNPNPLSTMGKIGRIILGVTKALSPSSFPNLEPYRGLLADIEDNLNAQQRVDPLDARYVADPNSAVNKVEKWKDEEFRATPWWQQVQKEQEQEKKRSRNKVRLRRRSEQGNADDKNKKKDPNTPNPKNVEIVARFIRFIIDIIRKWSLFSYGQGAIETSEVTSQESVTTGVGSGHPLPPLGGGILSDNVPLPPPSPISHEVGVMPQTLPLPPPLPYWQDNVVHMPPNSFSSNSLLPPLGLQRFENPQNGFILTEQNSIYHPPDPTLPNTVPLPIYSNPSIAYVASTGPLLKSPTGHNLNNDLKFQTFLPSAPATPNPIVSGPPAMSYHVYPGANGPFLTFPQVSLSQQTDVNSVSPIHTLDNSMPMPQSPLPMGLQSPLGPWKLSQAVKSLTMKKDLPELKKDGEEKSDGSKGNSKISDDFTNLLQNITAHPPMETPLGPGPVRYFDPITLLQRIAIILLKQLAKKLFNIDVDSLGGGSTL
eukprot:Nk52_evm103s352 gene=Nk52_evmTU103s352